MADTIREQLIQACVTRAQTLTTVEVKRVQRSQGESQDKFISIWDGDDQKISSAFGEDLNQFVLMLIAEWNPLDVNPSVAANAFIGEAVAAMLGTDHDLGGLADSIEKATASPTYPNDGSTIIQLSIAFLIKYRTAIGDPYTQP